MTDYDVTIIGAGPYGLSTGAHLTSTGVAVRIFGEPMAFWAHTMPQGMLLRSPRAASNIAAPTSDCTLDAYEVSSGARPCAPVPLTTFVEYGRWFQRQLCSNLDRRSVARVDRDQSDFILTLEDGELIRSRRVVVAAGLGAFQRKPP